MKNFDYQKADNLSVKEVDPIFIQQIVLLGDDIIPLKMTLSSHSVSQPV